MEPIGILVLMLGMLFFEKRPPVGAVYVHCMANCDAILDVEKFNRSHAPLAGSTTCGQVEVVGRARVRTGHGRCHHSGENYPVEAEL